LSFYEGVGVGDLKIEESESEVLYTDSTALAKLLHKTAYRVRYNKHFEEEKEQERRSGQTL
jgi:hypothetical protein